MELWIKVFEVMFPVIAVVSVGYVFGLFAKVNMKPVNTILLYLSTPCLIFTSLTEDRVQFIEILNIISIGTLLVLIGVPIIYLFLKLINKDPNIFLNPIIFPNTANLGLPVVLFAFGDAAFDYAILFTTIVFFLHCSFGIIFINGISNIKEVFKIPLIYTVALALVLNNYEVEIYDFHKSISFVHTASGKISFFIRKFFKILISQVSFPWISGETIQIL